MNKLLEVNEGEDEMLGNNKINQSLTLVAISMMIEDTVIIFLLLFLPSPVAKQKAGYLQMGWEEIMMKDLKHTKAWRKEESNFVGIRRLGAGVSCSQ